MSFIGFFLQYLQIFIFVVKKLETNVLVVITNLCTKNFRVKKNSKNISQIFFENF